jgi:hypothetical protein
MAKEEQRAGTLNCEVSRRVYGGRFSLSGIDANEYWKARADEHDCAAHEKMLASSRSGEGTKNPLKASKAAARGK